MSFGNYVLTFTEQAGIGSSWQLFSRDTLLMKVANILI